MRFVHCSLFLLVCLVNCAYAQKTSLHATVVEELAEKIKAAGLTKIPARIAIVPFAPLKQGEGQNVYGEYLTESLIGKLSEHSDKIKLFERKRLDAILKENELMLSGMMKPSEALKIGELIPIDALFSGTYTKLKSYIDVSGRLIDVSSGEILLSYSGRVKITKNIKTLFDEEEKASAAMQTAQTDEGKVVNNTTIINNNSQTASTSKADKEALCKQKTEKFNEKLNDLSTPEKVEAVVSEAMKTPFENVCGKLHYHLIYSLSRFNIHHDGYKSFLLSTLDTIAYPSGDDRAYNIFSYLVKDGEVDEKEWKVGFKAAQRVGDYTLSTYLGFLLNKISQPESPIIFKRIDEYFSKLNNKQVGLPRAIEYNKGFFEMMEAVNNTQALRLYVYEKYSDNVVTEPETSVSSHFMYLKRMYEEETSPEVKSKVIRWIANYFNKHVYKKSPEQLYEFASQFDMEPNEYKNNYITERNKERVTKFPAKDIEILINECRDKFTQYATQTPYASQKEDRINFCVKHGIAVPGEIPTITEIESILKGNNVDEQVRVSKLLLLMGAEVRTLEKTMISFLFKKSIDNKEELQEAQSNVTHVLGKIKTQDPRAIQSMIEKLMSYNYKESDNAKEALVNIGKPSVDPLLNRLKSTSVQEDGLRYQIIVLLGKIGQDAKPAVPALHKLLSQSTNKDVRYAIEATLQALED